MVTRETVIKQRRVIIKKSSRVWWIRFYHKFNRFLSAKCTLFLEITTRSAITKWAIKSMRTSSVAIKQESAYQKDWKSLDSVDLCLHIWTWTRRLKHGLAILSIQMPSSRNILRKSSYFQVPKRAKPRKYIWPIAAPFHMRHQSIGTIPKNQFTEGQTTLMS